MSAGLTMESVLSEPYAAGVVTAPIPGSSAAGGTGETRSSKLLALIMDQLTQDGALDIVEIPLAGKSSEADVMVVCSGRSTRQVASISEKLIDRLKHDAGVIARAEGKDAADWVLIDAGDVIVHVFRPEVRDFYQLEKMWQTAPDSTARAAV